MIITARALSGDCFSRDHRVAAMSLGQIQSLIGRPRKVVEVIAIGTQHCGANAEREEDFLPTETGSGILDSFPDRFSDQFRTLGAGIGQQREKFFRHPGGTGNRRT